MKTYLLILIFFISFAFQSFLLAQDLNDKVVATVGNLKITASEFQERYEFTPLFRKHIKRMTQALKVEFLYSLIAEKLWALQAEDMGYDTTHVMKFVTRKFENMFVRDALYHREIKDKVKVTDKEILQGYHRYNYKLEVNYLAADSKKDIYKLYNLLKDGIPFDTVLSARPEAKEQKTPEQIVFGQMAQSIEDSLYSLRIGHYTTPLNTPDGWYIFRLTNEIPQETSVSEQDAIKIVRKTIEARKEAILYRKYYHKFFDGKKVNANAPLFQSLARKMAELLQAKKKDYRTPDKDPVYFEVPEVLKVEKEFGPDSLKMTYIEFKENPISLKEFIEDLAFQGFSSKKVDLMSIASKLNAKNKEEIEHTLLARQGYKQGLQNLPGVQRDLAMWKENYLAQSLQSKFLDSAKVSHKELYNYYTKFNKDEDYPEEVNIVEILSDSTQLLDKILTELKHGGNIKKLAYMYTQRTWTKKDSGEFGYFPVTMYGEIGKIAANLKVGDIYGPLKVSNGYSVFKVIGKRAAKVEKRQPFDKEKSELKKDLSFKKEHNAIKNYTVMLARKFGIGINGRVLRSIYVTNLNSFGFRYLGFGGRITAVPVMKPNVDWVNPYLRSMNITP